MLNQKGFTIFETKFVNSGQCKNIWLSSTSPKLFGFKTDRLRSFPMTHILFAGLLESRGPACPLPPPPQMLTGPFNPGIEWKGSFRILHASSPQDFQTFLRPFSLCQHRKLCHCLLSKLVIVALFYVG